MKLAVLGTDQNVLALVAAAGEAGHPIVWLGDVRPEDAADVGQLLPGLTPRDDWELLLDHATADAVLVGGGTATPDLRAEQLKRLATDAVPLLAVHPASGSVLTYYEVDMARRESRGVVRHYSPLAGAPAIAELVEWVEHANGPVGAVHQVICQRELPDCSRDSVFRHLARDAELLRRLAGGVRSVNAVGPRSDDASFASLQVQMTGPGAATLRWSVVPSADGPPRAALSLVGERGIARLRMPADDGTPIGGEVDDDWQLEISAGGRSETRPVTTWNAPRAAIEELAAALPFNGTEASVAASTWSAATAAMEVVDAIELSLQKGRTIEVHQQQLTEQLAFRGTMAAMGCGLLVLGLAVLVVAGLFGDVIGLPLRAIWPWTLLVVLAMFLLLQVVPWLAAKKQPNDGGE
jgi:predicted dehydrogenase